MTDGRPDGGEYNIPFAFFLKKDGDKNLAQGRTQHNISSEARSRHPVI